MLVLEVYNKAEWEISGGNDDAEGRARKSESIKYLFTTGVDYCSLVLQVTPVAITGLTLLTCISLFFRAPDRVATRIPVR